jgi:hypothetical protein
MDMSLEGRLKNTSLPPTHALLTLVMRTTKDGSVAEAPVQHVHVTDTGVGFTDANVESFKTGDTQYKAARGAKGIGRFMWLKAFDRVRIESVIQVDGERILRTFDFTAPGGVSPVKTSLQGQASRDYGSPSAPSARISATLAEAPGRHRAAARRARADLPAPQRCTADRLARRAGERGRYGVLSGVVRHCRRTNVRGERAYAKGAHVPSLSDIRLRDGLSDRLRCDEVAGVIFHDVLLFLPLQTHASRSSYGARSSSGGTAVPPLNVRRNAVSCRISVALSFSGFSSECPAGAAGALL